MDKILMIASVASMIDQFNMPNIKLLKKRGCEVQVAANFECGNTSSKERIEEFKDELKKMNVPFHHVDFSRNIADIKSNIKAYKQLKNLMLKNNYKLVHCSSPIGGLLTRIAFHNSNTPVIYSAHGFHFYKGAPILNWVIYYPVEKLLAHCTDCLITTNEEDFKRVNRKFRSRNIKLVNGVGVDLSVYKPHTSENKKELRKEYGYKEDDFILIFAGELSYRKHQDLIIKALAELKGKITNIKLLLVGIGDSLGKYRELVNELGLEQYVDFLGYRNDLEKIMALSDVSISSSRQEGLPVNVMIAMATGLPLVVTDCRGNRDLVSNGKNGYIVGIEDIDKLAYSVEKLYRSEELRRMFGRYNQEHIKKYSIENIMCEMGKIYVNYVS
ncbi:MAG: glycosyltransferase family 4 protein [Clostridia bacterium]|jgi:glycosyltransferase EpsD